MRLADRKPKPKVIKPIDMDRVEVVGEVRAPTFADLAARAEQPDRLEEAIARYESAREEIVQELEEVRDFKRRLLALETATAPLLERSDVSLDGGQAR